MSGNGYRDYFGVLGVDRSADVDAIKSAFRKLARKYHPDVNPGDKSAEEKFKEISEAYEVLSDPEKRRRYEQFGQYWNQASPPSGNKGYADVDFGRYSNFDDFINDLLGRFSGQTASGFGSSVGSGFGFSGGFPGGSRSTSIDLDAEATIKLTFSEAFFGCERSLSINNEKVQVRIPAGMKDGSRLRLKGKGNVQAGTGRRGDLYLTLQLQKHPIWNLDGETLRADLPLSLDEMALGGPVRVAIPGGEATVNIPAGTSSGRVLRLKGKGWPNQNRAGDLLFTLVLKLPDRFSTKELELLGQLRELRSVNPRADWLNQAQIK
uniref:Heat shock protein DnaJ-like protein n=1 Tax=Paulinella chromatophora TaxID=39717 RepID=B1X577_PAUCH|nr:Heat shock protein DnaJ-like protein [Paulinella chromatophora]ACB43096.1 Heat shock protein DnaJ-like protein [Paulinella chromatophora]